MSGGQWHKLSSSDQETWDKLSEDAKAVVLSSARGDKKGGTPGAPTMAHPRPSRPPFHQQSVSPRKVNASDISIAEFLELKTLLHDSNIDDVTDREATCDDAVKQDSSDGDDKEDSTILVNAATRALIPASDIRRVLSDSSKRIDTGKPIGGKKPPPTASKMKVNAH